ncbi:MAG: hypothetical protein ABSA71_16715 [Desulfomonilia bacterium]
MRRFLTFLAVLILPLFLCAMTPLTESDMSNVSNPLSLMINPDNIMDINNGAKAWDDSGVISKFLLNSINLTWNVDLYLDKSNGETIETQETSKHFSSLSLLWGNGMFDNLQFFLIDPITGKSYTTIVSGEDTQTTYSNPQAEITHTMAYPIDYTTSLNNPYRYMIMDGNIEMRDTYRSPTTTIINAGSWVDIRTH